MSSLNSNKQPDSSWLSTATVDQLSSNESLICALYDLSAIKLGGPFKLKSGIESPIYIDLRLIISYPNLLRAVATCMNNTIQHVNYDRICGVPYTALPIGTLLSDISNKPMIMKRKEGAKTYGLKRALEGIYNANDTILIIEDLVTSGASVLETVEPIRNESLNVNDVVVIIDRQQNAKELLQENNLKLHSLFTLTDVLDTLYNKQYITQDTVDKVQHFIQSSQFTQVPASTQQSTSTSTQQQTTASNTLQSIIAMKYEDRLQHITNTVAKQLLNIVLTKQTNLCLSIDVTDKNKLYEITDLVGPYIAVLKTHVDILNDFDESVITRLTDLSSKHNFLIFEDRKFADIGNTVSLQYSSGIYHIADWSHITNAHIVSGSGIIDGLKTVGLNKQRGLLLLAEMSSKGALTTGDYTKSAVSMAEQNTDFVIGFICQNQLSSNAALLNFTPGIQFNNKGDGLGQQYNEPDTAVLRGTDIVIVGRGIINDQKPAQAAQKYKQAAWNAYLKRTTQLQL